MNHYQILGVQPTASQHVIKRAYRERALKYHPDRNPDDLERSTEMFRLVQEAYDVLSDRKQRKIYDLNHRGYERSTEQSNPSDRASDARAEQMIRDFLNVEQKTSLESKDAFIALVFVFLGHLSVNRWLDMSFATALGLLSLLIVGVGGSLFLRAVSRLVWSKLQRLAPDNFMRISLYNAVSIPWIDFCCRQFGTGDLSQYIIMPIIPALFVSIPIGLFAASVGRAVASGLGSVAGFITGGAVSAGLTGLLGMWVVMVFLVGPDGGEIRSKQAFLSLFYGVSLASALGSVSMGSMFIYDILEWAESLFDKFRPENQSSSLEVVDE